MLNSISNTTSDNSEPSVGSCGSVSATIVHYSFLYSFFHKLNKVIVMLVGLHLVHFYTFRKVSKQVSTKDVHVSFLWRTVQKVWITPLGQDGSYTESCRSVRVAHLKNACECVSYLLSVDLPAQQCQLTDA